MNPTVTTEARPVRCDCLSDIGSPGVVGPEHEGLPWMLDDPYVQEDEVFLAKEQPLPAAASPTAHQTRYVPGVHPKDEPEEDDDGGTL
ncbi:hypothetical protein Tco_0477884 [Tanacetum coccineum]